MVVCWVLSQRSWTIGIWVARFTNQCTQLLPYSSSSSSVTDLIDCEDLNKLLTGWASSASKPSRCVCSCGPMLVTEEILLLLCARNESEDYTYFQGMQGMEIPTGFGGSFSWPSFWTWRGRSLFTNIGRRMRFLTTVEQGNSGKDVSHGGKRAFGGSVCGLDKHNSRFVGLHRQKLLGRDLLFIQRYQF